MNSIIGNTDNRPDRRCRTVGCMLGGAVGDAMGAPAQFLDFASIRQHFGDTGIRRFEPAYGRRGAITDDTQMTLFTAEGLILAKVRKDYEYGGKAIPAIYHAYLRWLSTQDCDHQQQLIGLHGTCAVVDGILTGHRELFSRRAPGNTCLASLQSGRMGTMGDPINDSKGCGGIMRVAPIGLAIRDAEHAFRLGAESAAITHGHSDGYLAAGLLSAMVSRIAGGAGVADALADACRILEGYPAHGACLKAVQDAVDLSAGSPLSPDRIETLGSGRVAQEALAIGLGCALAAGDDFRRGVLTAVNHAGASDSTGTIAGSIMGAHLGVEGIASGWLKDLELEAVIREVAVDLFDQYANGQSIITTKEQ